ncbi:unnamed protein product, partial [Prorocentrum cordatum]
GIECQMWLERTQLVSSPPLSSPPVPSASLLLLRFLLPLLLQEDSEEAEDEEEALMRRSSSIRVLPTGEGGGPGCRSGRRQGRHRRDGDAQGPFNSLLTSAEVLMWGVVLPLLTVCTARGIFVGQLRLPPGVFRHVVPFGLSLLVGMLLSTMGFIFMYAASALVNAIASGPRPAPSAEAAWPAEAPALPAAPDAD